MTTDKIYSDWSKWHGGERPVPPDTFVEVKFSSGFIAEAGLAIDYCWRHLDCRNDIVSYRTVVEQPDLEAAEQLLRNNGYTITPPAKPLMTATEINALPHKAREYIHQLEANTDPAGMVRENMQLLDTNKGLQVMYRNRTDELDRVQQDLDDCRELSKWLASRINARQEVREVCKLITQEKPMNETEQALTDELIDQIESAARASFRRHQRSIKGQTLTAADNYDWHLLHAAYQAGIHAMRAEKDRLMTCLEKANISTEHFEREWYLRGDELDNLRAQLAEAQTDAEVNKQINRACAELPEDHQITIELERDSGWVRILKEGEDMGFDDPCEGVASSVSAAIDAAKGETR